MDFLTESQKIVRCAACGMDFLSIGSVSEDEEYFCSADCTEEFQKKRK
ncbi:MAG TPA: hypothetical protein VJI75_01000 [Candidatus Nanoarchaeia archaeon]|nr:hypothetical protein [Candidatus Nanoarchaeia archaeon]